MCQEIIFKHLLTKRMTGDDSYYSVAKLEKELTKAYSLSSTTVRQKVNKLYAYGFLDIMIPKGKKLMYYRRRFRIKDQYVKEELKK